MKKIYTYLKRLQTDERERINMCNGVMFDGIPIPKKGRGLKLFLKDKEGNYRPITAFDDRPASYLKSKRGWIVWKNSWIVSKITSKVTSKRNLPWSFHEEIRRVKSQGCSVLPKWLFFPTKFHTKDEGDGFCFEETMYEAEKIRDFYSAPSSGWREKYSELKMDLVLCEIEYAGGIEKHSAFTSMNIRDANISIAKAFRIIKELD